MQNVVQTHTELLASRSDARVGAFGNDVQRGLVRVHRLRVPGETCGAYGRVGAVRAQAPLRLVDLVVMALAIQRRAIQAETRTELRVACGVLGQR